MFTIIKTAKMNKPKMEDSVSSRKGTKKPITIRSFTKKEEDWIKREAKLKGIPKTVVIKLLVQAKMEKNNG